MHCLLLFAWNTFLLHLFFANYICCLRVIPRKASCKVHPKLEVIYSFELSHHLVTSLLSPYLSSCLSLGFFPTFFSSIYPLNMEVPFDSALCPFFLSLYFLRNLLYSQWLQLWPVSWWVWSREAPLRFYLVYLPKYWIPLLDHLYKYFKPSLCTTEPKTIPQIYFFFRKFTISE